MTEFDRVSPWLQAALDEGGNSSSLEDIRHAISDGSMRLLTSAHAAILVKIVTYPQFKAMRFIGAGGETNEALDDFRKFAEAVPQMTRDAGCKRYELQGRKGWLRVFKDYGLTSHLFMFKEVH